ncbi:MAG TPA: peptidyl-prolyl cis-trans isomerase [Bacillota bacterium]|nr:peptidyl-prolyl cis-trans isomerase [Bacillota bacterium]HQD39243.1 peptidyl-prolyl cis-trans isomerase [Bacillota bacterium]
MRNRILICSLIAVLVGLMMGAAVAEEKVNGDDGDIVVVVNGEPITAFKFYAEMEKQVGAQILQNMIIESLIMQEVERLKLSITDADIAQQLEMLRMQFPNEQSFQYALMGMSQENLYAQLKIQAALWKLGTRNVKVTEEEMKQYYEENKDDYKEPETVRARHILVKTEEEAKKIIEALDAGEDFAELAKAHGLDGTKDRGGDLGYFSYEEMVPEFSAAAFALEVGQYTKEPVQTQFGYHVIKLEERNEEKQYTLEEVKDSVQLAILSEKAASSQEIIQDLLKKAKFDWRWERYSNIFSGLVP